MKKSLIPSKLSGYILTTLVFASELLHPGFSQKLVDAESLNVGSGLSLFYDRKSFKTDEVLAIVTIEDLKQLKKEVKKYVNVISLNGRFTDFTVEVTKLLPHTDHLRDLHAVVLNQCVYVLGSDQNDKTREVESRLMYVPYDETPVNPDVTELLLAKMTSKSSGSVYYQRMSWVVSPDKSKVLFYAREKHHGNLHDREPIRLILMDDRGNELRNEIMPCPYPFSVFNPVKYAISNEGDVFFWTGLSDDELSKKELKDRSLKHGGIGIFALTNGWKDFEYYETGAPGASLSDFHLFVDNRGLLWGVGLYANNSEGGKSGFFWVAIDANAGEILLKNLEKFEMSFLGQHLTAQEQKVVESKLDTKTAILNLCLRLTHSITRPDGGFYFVGEMNNVGNNLGVQYAAGDIFVFEVSANGEFERANKIAKRQSLNQNTWDTQSFAFWMEGSDLFLLFNDHIDNMKIKPGTRYKSVPPKLNSKAMAVACVKYSQGGQVQKEHIINHPAIKNRYFKSGGEYGGANLVLNRDKLFYIVKSK